MIIQKINTYLPKTTFGRKLKKDEEQDYKENAIKPALDFLQTKEIAMIIHGTSYPQDKNDIGVGTPYGKVAAQLIPFEILHGFNSNQLGPIGELNSVIQISPYKSSVETKNTLFIDFEKLTTKEYGNLLEDIDIEAVTGRTDSTNKNFAHSNFADAFANNKKLLKIAYNKYQKELSSHPENEIPEIAKLHFEQENFESKNLESLNNATLFHVLKIHNGTDDFTKWDETDRNLHFNNRDSKSIKRLNYLNKIYEDEMKEYRFGQFILNKQIKENTQLRKNLDFKYISDMLVGFSPADEWAHQDLFLKGYRMGCPYGGPNGGIQKWDVPVLDPKKLFNSDGSIAQGGKYLKYKLDDALTNFDNVRIDHVLGLVDPFIYEKNGTRCGNISSMPDIDPDRNYEKVLERIILPTLKEHGLDKNTPVWEDLVTDTPTFNRIYYEENNLPGITQLEFKKAEGNENSQNWTLIGSHDSDPANLMIKKDWVRSNDAWNPMYLAGVLNAAHDSQEYCKKIAQNDHERVKAKFAEMFMMGKKIQIAFADFFGIEKTYNVGGNDTNPDNWKLRLDKDFENKYYENLSSDNPTAINMPEILKLAVRGKADMAIARKENDASEKAEQAEKIIKNLEHYEQILKEKE